jgi:hypothetical protein
MLQTRSMLENSSLFTKWIIRHYQIFLGICSMFHYPFLRTIVSSGKRPIRRYVDKWLVELEGGAETDG